MNDEAKGMSSATKLDGELLTHQIEARVVAFLGMKYTCYIHLF